MAPIEDTSLVFKVEKDKTRVNARKRLFSATDTAAQLPALVEPPPQEDEKFVEDLPPAKLAEDKKRHSESMPKPSFDYHEYQGDIMMMDEPALVQPPCLMPDHDDYHFTPMMDFDVDPFQRPKEIQPEDHL